MGQLNWLVSRKITARVRVPALLLSFCTYLTQVLQRVCASAHALRELGEGEGKDQQERGLRILGWQSRRAFGCPWCVCWLFRRLRGPRRWPHPCGVFWVLLGACASGVRCHLSTGVAVQMCPNITKDNKHHNQEPRVKLLLSFCLQMRTEEVLGAVCVR